MRRPAAILLALLLLGPAFAGVRGARPPRPQQRERCVAADTVPDSLRSLYWYTEGIKRRVIRRDTCGAARAFAEAIRLDTACAPAYYELAVTPVAGRGVGERIRLAASACRLDTANKWYLELYGQTLVAGARYGEAAGVYRRLTRRDPRNPEYVRLLALLLEREERPLEAIALLDSAALRFGRVPLFEALKRNLLLSTRQFDRARAEAEACVAAAPYEASYRLALAEVCAATGCDSLAAASFAAAVELAPADLAVLTAAAEWYRRRGEWRPFLAVTRRLFESEELPAADKCALFRRLTLDPRFYREYYLQLDNLSALLDLAHPSDPAVIALRGDHLIASGRLDEALAHYRRHTADRPPLKECFTMVVDLESYLGRPDSADRWLDEAQRLFPRDADFGIARGHIRAYAGRHAEAVRSYRAALRLVTADSLRGVVRGCIGDCLHAAGKPRRGYRAYRRSLRLHGANAAVLNNYAYNLAEEGRDLRRALDLSGRALALDGSNPTYLDTYGWVLYRLGRTAEAKRQLQLAVSLDGGRSPELLLHYGDILAACGELYMAGIYWRKALETGYDEPAAIERRLEALERSDNTNDR